MRLYRQTAPGDWRPLVAQMATEMAAMRTA
jgi:hypothetical protein